MPASARVLAYLHMRKGSGQADGWVFPAPTKSGHVEASTLKKQHARTITLSEVAPFALYTLRHTCITRWAKHIDAYPLHVIAGHTDMNTTKRYIHPSDADVVLAAMKRHVARTLAWSTRSRRTKAEAARQLSNWHIGHARDGALKQPL